MTVCSGLLRARSCPLLRHSFDDARLVFWKLSETALVRGLVEQGQQAPLGRLAEPHMGFGWLKLKDSAKPTFPRISLSLFG